MAYQGNSSWGSSYYDSNYYNTGWRPTNHVYSQHEQYNPVYPSYDGSSSFFSSSNHQAQQYSAPSYYPSKAKTSVPKVSVKRRNQVFRNRKKNTDPVVPHQNFRLITVNPDVTGTTKLAENVVEPAPVTQSKVAPATNKPANKPKRGRGGQKMPTYRSLQGNGWESSGYQNKRGGGYPAQRGGRGGQRGGGFRGPPKPSNNKEDIPFVAMADEDPAITLTVSSENIVAFHGFDSVFTTQHNFPVLIDNRIYTSCDHYYQIRKVIDLTGVSSDKLDCTVRDENGKPILTAAADAIDPNDKKAHSAIVREILKASNISKEKVEEWRYSKGLAAIQKALLAKVTQSAHLREALKESRGQILVHAYPRDSIYGTGCGVPQIKKWLEDLSKAGVKNLKVPAVFPLDQETIKKCPVFAFGRNVLGVILMQLREKVVKAEVEVKDMTDIYNALRVDESNDVSMDPAPAASGFTIDDRKIGTF